MHFPHLDGPQRHQLVIGLAYIAEQSARAAEQFEDEDGEPVDVSAWLVAAAEGRVAQRELARVKSAGCQP